MAAAGAAAEFPCALCGQFLHDYLEYSLRICFRKREEAAMKLHAEMLREILADIRGVYQAKRRFKYLIQTCRQIQKKEGITAAIHHLFRTEPRIYSVVDEWVIRCTEAGLEKVSVIDTWVSHTLYEIFMIIKGVHKEHTWNQKKDYVTILVL